MRPKFILVSLLLLTFPRANAAQTSDQAIVLGSVDYFGYSGLDLAKLDDQLPVSPGQTVTQSGFEKTRASIREAVFAALGKPPTDINATCCDADNRLMIYIGLPGGSSRP